MTTMDAAIASVRNGSHFAIAISELVFNDSVQPSTYPKHISDALNKIGFFADPSTTYITSKPEARRVEATVFVHTRGADQQ